MDKSEAFALWNELKNMSWTPDMIVDIQDEWEKKVISLHKEIIGRKKADWRKAYNALVNAGYSELVAKEQKPFADLVTSRYDNFSNRKKTIEESLKEFSGNYEVEKQEYFSMLKSKSGGDFRSQGFGSNKYARSYLEEDLQKLLLLGFDAEIREGESHESGGMYSMRYTTYELWAKISPFDFAMMEMDGNFISVLNWAVLCWRKNTNPKVYFPFLSAEDYEKSQVLAYNTDYQITKDNMMLEPSWDEINKIRKS